MKNKNTFFKFSFAIMSFALLISSACKKDEPGSNLPSLKTVEITNVKWNGAKSGGMISADGGDSIFLKGVCWSTEENPTNDDNSSFDGMGIADFTSAISGLQASTKYYVRAFATNINGTGYGDQLSFETPEKPVKSMSAKINGSSFTASSISVMSFGSTIGITGMSGSKSIIIWTSSGLTTGAHSLSTAGSYIVQYAPSAYSLYGSDSGTLNITEYNVSSGKISGTFSCVCSDNTITEGQFVAYK